MFDPVDPKQRLPELEEGILRYWQEEDIFKRSLRLRSTGTGDLLDGPVGGKGEAFSFYDGPPFATGLPHYGHLLAGTIKDVIPRYQTMRGKYVERRFGWDCHGLPVENLVEKEQNIASRREIEQMGVDTFNALCRTSVQRYTKEWRTVVSRMGRFVDMDNDYRTMDPEYMESIWWVFNQLHTKGLVYEGRKAMQVCPRCETPLSNFEVTQGYKDIDDIAVTWKFRLAGEKNTFVLAWTTTPWSTLSTMGLSIKPDALYAKVRAGDEDLIMVKSRVAEVMKGTEQFEIVDEFPGRKLVGKAYEHIAPWYGEIPEVKKNPHVYHIFAADYVDPSEGTGIVTINGSYGEIDMEAAKKNKLPIIMDVQMNGHFGPEAGPYAGMHVEDGEKQIIEDSRKKRFVWRKETYRHSYPHCWRCETPLLNYATSSWFVNVSKIKEDILASNAKTTWVPAHVRDGRFGKWLAGARDWAISRNRYWGTPLPIWRCNETKDLTVIQSRDELMAQQRIRFTKVSVLRHGESEGNLVPVYQGTCPGTHLTATGKKQAAAAADFLNAGEISAIYCSPLDRTKETAAIIAKATGAPVIVDERLHEVLFGDYEGKTVDFSDLTFVKARRAHKLETNAPESIYHFPGMETFGAVHERISAFLEEVLPRYRGGHIVIVTHADPLQNIQHFFTLEDPMKLNHRPYPRYAEPVTFFWDHRTQSQLDLHKHIVDDIMWGASEQKNDIQLTLVRHGETDYNAKDIVNGGNVDTLLNETGRSQVRALAKKLKKKKYDVIISSNLKRAVETAEILSAELKVPHAARWKELNERDTGDWSGKPEQKYRTALPNGVIASPGLSPLTPPGGESFEAFLRRLEEALQRIRAEYPGKRVLVACHGGPLKCLQALVDNLSLAEAAALAPKNAETIDLKLPALMQRIPEVLDCWFESGSMPYAQSHFPFAFSKNNHNSKFPPGFPADFIAEGMDQTRGWFYTLMILSTALYKQPAFLNCIVNGIVLAEDGKKMSKRLKNYPEPIEVVHRHGADAVRFTLMSSPAVRGEDLRFSETLVSETVRSVLLPLWNVFVFFVTYANAAKFEPVESRRHSNHPLDRYIRAEVQDLVNRITRELDRYDLSAACSEMHDTIDALTNWYVRLSRRRFAGKGAVDEEDTSPSAELSTHEGEQTEALATLYDVLLTICQVLAPFCPFITDAIYVNLVPEDHGSVHLTNWPDCKELTTEERALIERNRLLRLIVSLGLGIRGAKKLKVRQPLARALVALPPSVSTDVALPPALAKIALTEGDRDLLKNELNVKDLEFAADPGTLAQRFAQVDARKVGPRLGARVQEIIKAGKAGDFTVREDGAVLILDEVLAPDEVNITYRSREGEDIAADKGVVVSMETTVTEALKREGLARDLIRAVQKIRKEAGLHFADSIALEIDGLQQILQEHGNVIAQETHAVLQENDGNPVRVNIDGSDVTVRLKKLSHG
ncbi:MAG: class I tRNA ligase family protein [Candidatus Peribacteraceae bacterium]|nr:class I tRNA ligase family protein [Candidatus Peribacteraceae bacterium]MDD5739703.1 class I tRNA ligase family protein [Candidatus Peribacteraceae bacterium]